MFKICKKLLGSEPPGTQIIWAFSDFLKVLRLSDLLIFSELTHIFWATSDLLSYLRFSKLPQIFWVTTDLWVTSDFLTYLRFSDKIYTSWNWKTRECKLGVVCRLLRVATKLIPLFTINMKYETETWEILDKNYRIYKWKSKVRKCKSGAVCRMVGAAARLIPLFTRIKSGRPATSQRFHTEEIMIVKINLWALFLWFC